METISAAAARASASAIAPAVKVIVMEFPETEMVSVFALRYVVVYVTLSIPLNTANTSSAAEVWRVNNAKPDTESKFTGKSRMKSRIKPDPTLTCAATAPTWSQCVGGTGFARRKYLPARSHRVRTIIVRPWR